MNINSDIVSLIIFLIIVGSSVIQSLFKKSDSGTTGGTKSSKSLSEIKKYLEEMAEGTNPDTSKAQPLYTQPYAGASQKPSSFGGQNMQQKAPTGQRGFNELLESLPPVPEKERKAVVMSSSTPVAKSAKPAKANAKANAKNQKDASVIAATQMGFGKFNLPAHLTDIQKAIAVTEILKQPKAFEY